MTIAAVITQARFTGNGATSSWSFGNKVFSASDLIVTLLDPLGNSYLFTNFTNVALGLAYNVTNVDVDTGCQVNLTNTGGTPTPLTALWLIDIRSATPETQSTSIKNQGSFLPELHEEAFDRLTRESQDLLRLTYTYGIHASDNEVTPWAALPNPAGRANKALLFDVNGQPYAGGGPVGTGLAAGLTSSAAIGVNPNSDPQGNIVVFAGGTLIGNPSGGAIRIGTPQAPLVNSGVSSAQFAITINVDGSAAPGGANPAIQGIILRNTSTNVGAINYAVEIGNDQTGQEMILGTTSSLFSGTLWAGGPAGQNKFINVFASIPLVFAFGITAGCVMTANKITYFGPLNGGQVDMTPDKGTFTATLATGCTTTPTAVLSFVRNGNQVTIYSDNVALTGTGGGASPTAFSVTGIPASLQPANTRQVPVAGLQDNGVGGLIGSVFVTGNSLLFAKLNVGTGAVSTTGWTGSGTKGYGAAFSVTYPL